MKVTKERIMLLKVISLGTIIGLSTIFSLKEYLLSFSVLAAIFLVVGIGIARIDKEKNFNENWLEDLFL
jgi:hypothetical protein